ncbi:MAG: hypothetical protein NVSMB68_06510 [Thermoanaerobaculia bacterium]
MAFPWLARILLVSFGFVFAAIFIGSHVAPRLIRLIERIDIARGLFFASILFALGLACIAVRIGSSVIIGAFAAGLVLARTHKGKQIEQEVHEVAQFFIPIFFVAVGAAIDLRTLNPLDAEARRFLLIGVGLTLIGIAGKVLAGLAVMRKGLRRFVVGVGMIPRGEVGLIFAQVGLTAGILSSGLYSAVALMVLLTTFVTPPLLRRALEQRSSQ